MNEPIIKNSGIREVRFGKNVVVVNPVNLYECEIGDNCFIGPFVEIQKNVRIGENCRIQSHAFLCEFVTLGDNCFVSHGAKFINDKFLGGKRAQGNKDLWKPTTVGNNVLIGTNATIMPVTITDNVVIGAGSVVTRDIREPGIYAGNPTRKIKDIG